MRLLPGFVLGFTLIFTLSPSVSATDYRGDCTIVFHGSSTLHDFQGKAGCQPFTVSKIDGVIDMSKVSVAIADMDTHNAKRDKKMREMFEEDRFPVITGSAGVVALKDIRASITREKGADSGKVGFTLKIREIAKPVTATVTNVVETDSRITADLAFTLSLAEYRLKPPSVLGVISVDDKVSVTATVVLDSK
ncbi:MAG: hypothetical protein A2075_21035 [Geobacteraceae bacterium GWC2_58_44]|nr:MAG: hypothetical protein A2075_21035 [Geobacteraceae bacterium GWC2_58_44]HBG05487.1 hypothetical protein [Geobacter sp.]